MMNKPNTPAVQPVNGAVTKVFTCTPANQREMAAAVKAWPQLHALVKDLQAADLFPGLRAMRIRLTGNESFVAQGLGAIAAINATKPVLSIQPPATQIGGSHVGIWPEPLMQPATPATKPPE